jgi:hypothetical protein
MEYAWNIQKIAEAWLLLQDTIQLEKQKNETIISVIKRLFGEHITSRLVRTQNRELSLRCIAYNICID